ncbi:MAG: hypothetical protein WA960_06835 [Tunicatimonas sp.]
MTETAIASGEISTLEIPRESIPAQVFLNHFFALNYHIQHDEHAHQLSELPYLQQFEARVDDTVVASVQKHLLNSWNTEYTLRSSAQATNESYLRHTLHWTFPQAFYSVQESLLAMLRLHGITVRQPERVIAEGSKLIARGAYPQAVSFYATGHPHQPRMRRLPYGRLNPSLQLLTSEPEAQRQIGQFLRTTHRQRAQQVRQAVQANEQIALRTRTGKVLKRFDERHWQQINWRIGYTTVFDLLARLRISPGHREIERFIEADIDVALFHKSLLSIVEYLNFVHEAYVVWAVGTDAYQEWLNGLPDYLRDGFVAERFAQRMAGDGEKG